MSMSISLNVEDTTVQGHSHIDCNWLALTQWSGTHEACTRKIESSIALHFRSQEGVRQVISQLQQVLAMWAETPKGEHNA